MHLTNNVGKVIAKHRKVIIPRPPFVSVCRKSTAKKWAFFALQDIPHQTISLGELCNDS